MHKYDRLMMRDVLGLSWRLRYVVWLHIWCTSVTQSALTYRLHYNYSSASNLHMAAVFKHPTFTTLGNSPNASYHLGSYIYSISNLQKVPPILKIRLYFFLFATACSCHFRKNMRFPGLFPFSWHLLAEKDKVCSDGIWCEKVTSILTSGPWPHV